MAQTKKINRGLYQMEYKGRTFQIENINIASDGEIPVAWMLYEMVNGERDFWNDFVSKKNCILAVKEYLDT